MCSVCVVIAVYSIIRIYSAVKHKYNIMPSQKVFRQMLLYGLASWGGVLIETILILEFLINLMLREEE
jgi:hypothetical protein